MRYRRPNQFSNYDQDSKQDKLKEAGDTLHTLQCDVEYYLHETDSKNTVPTKHGLDMMLKHIHREIWEAKNLIHETKAQLHQEGIEEC